MKKRTSKEAWLKTLIGLAVVGATAARAGAQESSGGQQQPGLVTPEWSSIIWVLVIFLIVVVVLYKTAWKNVLAGLKAREERIRRDIADAETARTRAEASLQEYNRRLTDAEQKVRDILGQAAADAEKLATSIRMRATQEAEEAKERATRDIEAAKHAALGEIYDQAAVLATNVAEKIIRRALRPEDQRELVSQSLQELQTAERN